MNEYLLEPFLIQYYLLEAICSSFLTQEAKTEMFYGLSEIFAISDKEELECYHADSNLDHYRTVTDFASYERLCRTIEFAERSGQDIEITERDRIILAQKREAMAIKSELFRTAKNMTKDTVVSAITTMAMNGNIDAMSILSYMEYNGICVCRDAISAKKRMRLCAKWNNLFSNLMGICYDDENKAEYYSILYTIMRSATQKRVFEHIKEVRSYDGSCEKNSIAKIIEKAFGLGIIKRNVYDRAFSKVAFSEIVSAEDKEKILWSKQKDMIASLSDIPFGITRGELIFDEKCTQSLPLCRAGEIKKILQNIAVATTCSAEAYTPLMIVTSDDYIVDMYSKMLKRGFSESAVIELDAATLSGQDFTAGRENVFLRGLSETKAARTLFMIRHCEELDDAQLEELEKMLDCEYRRKFKLFAPPVSLDLSGLIFVLFGAERNRRCIKLSESCDTLRAERISAEEKISVVDSVFDCRAKSFKLKDVRMEDGCREYLTGYDTKQIQQAIDGMLRSAVFEKKNIITLADLKAICKEQNISGSKRGFGYMGGDQNAKD